MARLTTLSLRDGWGGGDSHGIPYIYTVIIALLNMLTEIVAALYLRFKADGF